MSNYCTHNEVIVPIERSLSFTETNAIKYLYKRNTLICIGLSEITITIC